jgi:hypothetical protein
MIGNLWSEFIRSSTKHRTQGGDFTSVDSVNITPADVARMMDLLKISRSVHGDPLNVDNYVDGAGYQALAGMLELGDREVPAPPRPTGENRPFNPEGPTEKAQAAVDALKAKDAQGLVSRRDELAKSMAAANAAAGSEANG